MPIIDPAIRPPAEADSFLLQVTTGCSANTCTFCGAYKGKPFAIKNSHEIMSDIHQEAIHYPDTRRVFLMDGDALAMDNTRLIPILDELNKTFPYLARVSAYANGFNIMRKSDNELQALLNKKLRLIYIGLESGSQSILDMCQKKATAEDMTKAVQRCAQIGIKSSVIVLLGLGGKTHSKTHVSDTIKVLNQMQPRYLSFLSVMLIPGTKLHQQQKAGVFKELTAKELLQETHDIIQGLDLKMTVFRTDHASNYLSLEGRLPHDKQRLLTQVKYALTGRHPLRPDFYRGL